MDRTKASTTDTADAHRAAVFADAEAQDLAQVYGPRMMQCPPEYTPVRDQFLAQDIAADSSDSAASDAAETAPDCALAGDPA